MVIILASNLAALLFSAFVAGAMVGAFFYRSRGSEIEHMVANSALYHALLHLSRTLR